MKSIYLRNFIFMVVMITACLLMIVFSVVGIGQNYVITEYRQDMRNSANEVAHAASAISETDTLNSWNLSMILSSISKATGNHVFVTDATGKIVCCCDGMPICSHLGKQVSVGSLYELSEEGAYEDDTDFNGIFDEKCLAIAVPVENASGSAILGFVVVCVVKSTIFSSWHAFMIIMMLVILVAFVAVLTFSFMFSKSMAKPLDEIADASRMFARGDFSVRVKEPADPSSEMGALITSFNSMADSLENAEKRRSEFISNVSHELRTPMTTIAGFADGILDGTIPKDQETKYLISIRDETRRLARLVRSMLDASKTQANSADPSKRTVFDITELVVQVLLSFEDRATKKGLDVDPQFPDNSIMVRADKDGITQVVYNLLDNAVKFASNDTCITLRIYKEGEKAYVSVKDHGQVIPPDDLPYIFDRFHKSDKSRSVDKDGVGLGLYLVKSIINGHDEDIAVRSEGDETEFVFSLPLVENK